MEFRFIATFNSWFDYKVFIDDFEKSHTLTYLDVHEVRPLEDKSKYLIKAYITYLSE